MKENLRPDKIQMATILAEGSYHPSAEQGATQTGVEEVTKRFKKYAPVVISSHMPGSPVDEISQGVSQHRIKIGPLEKVLRPFHTLLPPGACYLYKAAQFIKENDIRLVHVRNRPLYMPVLRRLLGGKVKLVLHEHNQNIADTLSEKKAVEVFGSIDAYVAVSKFTYDYEVTDRYPQYKNKSRYILNGVNLDKFRPVWEQKEKAIAARREHGLADSTTVLFVGAIRERKGVRELVEAFKTIVKKHPEAKLIIAGGSKDNLEANDAFAKKLRADASEISNNVLFLGYTPPAKVQDIYLLADIFVGPSLWEEPFGLVFAEASASGLPVIGSRRGGIPEIIRDGRTGLLINDPQDPAEIAEKISSLIASQEKRSELGRAARKYMEEKFSWDRTAGEIEDLYDSLLKDI